MNKTIIILAIIISTTYMLFACGCGGPKNNLKIDIDSSEVIFLGIINEINKEHTFHLNNGRGTGLKFINFDVLKSYKGLNEAQLKVTLFDSFSNSSCEGIIYGKQVGDTVLVFADEFNNWMLGSYLCGRHPTIQQLTDEEANFIDTAIWNNPRTKYHDAEVFLKRVFSKPNIQIQHPKEYKNKVNLLFYLSLGLNLVLGLLLLRKNVNVI